MTFHKNYLKRISRYIERTRNDHGQISNSKNVLIRVMGLVVCSSSDDALYISMKFHKTVLNGFQVLVERTRFCERQKDGRTDGWTDKQGKKPCVSVLSEGADIIKKKKKKKKKKKQTKKRQTV